MICIVQSGWIVAHFSPVFGDVPGEYKNTNPSLSNDNIGKSGSRFAETPEETPPFYPAGYYPGLSSVIFITDSESLRFPPVQGNRICQSHGVTIQNYTFPAESVTVLRNDPDDVKIHITIQMTVFPADASFELGKNHIQRKMLYHRKGADPQGSSLESEQRRWTRSRRDLSVGARNERALSFDRALCRGCGLCACRAGHNIQILEIRATLSILSNYNC